MVGPEQLSTTLNGSLVNVTWGLDALHSSEQPKQPQSKTERRGNQKILVLLSIMHTRTVSAFILHCAHLVHQAQ